MPNHTPSLVLSLTPTSLSSYPVHSDDPVRFVIKVNVSFHPISSFCSYNHLFSHSCSLIASLDSISLLSNAHETLSHLDVHSAMIKKMDALDDNGTWDLVHLPDGKKANGCCWVFLM